MRRRNCIVAEAWWCAKRASPSISAMRRWPSIARRTRSRCVPARCSAGSAWCWPPARGRASPVGAGRAWGQRVALPARRRRCSATAGQTCGGATRHRPRRGIHRARSRSHCVGAWQAGGRPGKRATPVEPGGVAELSAHVLATHRVRPVWICAWGYGLGRPLIDGKRLLAIEVDESRSRSTCCFSVSVRFRRSRWPGLRELEWGADGIVVDTPCQTSDESVLAVGDCTRFPDRRSGVALRLESVQNASDQARTAVATLTGAARPHDAVPWFWSDQGGLRLQMAGLVPPEGLAGATTFRRPGANPASFSLLHYADAQLLIVSSL